MLEKGMKIVLKKSMGNFDRVGEVCTVEEIVSDYVLFTFGKNNGEAGVVNVKLLDTYFDIYEEEKIIAPTVTKELIAEIIAGSEITVNTVFDKCTIVTAKLPNGFVITESSACVSPENYDEEIGAEICMNKIIDKVWELEGYRLQCDLYELGYISEDECDCPHDAGCLGCGLCE